MARSIQPSVYSILRTALFVFLIFGFYAEGNAQRNQVQRPEVITETSAVRYVPSLASRSELIPFQDVVQEARDGRSNLNIPCPEVGSTGDDALAMNPHPATQSIPGRAPSLVFDAYSSGSQPTDPAGAVGPNHYLAVFNTGFIIFDKSGTDLTGQLAVTNIFSSGGCCDLTASYDKAADRWVLSYLFVGAGAEIAVSDGPNPVTAGWYVYSIPAIADYQKLSVWSDGYYLTENTTGTNRVWAMERDEMLLGNSAQVIGFPLPGIVTSGFYAPQALNVTNDDMPAAGNLPIVYLQDDAWGVAQDHIKLWLVNVDWVTPGNSTISATPQEIITTPFISVFDGGSFTNLTQPGGGTNIDALQATIMNQAQFRRFGTHNSAVFNFVVDTDGGAGELAGVRWQEFRQSGDGQPWSLYQQGTYNAADGKHAWNASLMMDDLGNIGMGYTGMSGPTTPSTVRVSSYYTGRLATDPLGTMTIAEELIAAGTANIPGTRYGDYSKIDIDPNDDQTFWFINEYNNGGRGGVVGVFNIAQLSLPFIGFSSTSDTVTEDADLCFSDFTVPLTIPVAPSADADVNFVISGASTTSTGLDFDLLTPSVTFPSGSTTSQDMVVRVYHDGLEEVDETLEISFTVNPNGGNAMVNTNANTFTLTVQSTDVAPVAFQNATLFSDGFETYSDFTIANIGGWTMFDGDGDQTYGSVAYDFPNENYTGTFIVFNPSQTTPAATGTDWDVRTGDKGYYCFSESIAPFGNDDYIFTPQIDLDGTNSELRFWARSLTANFGLERFQVGVSTTNTNPGSFTFISTPPYVEPPTAWTEYIYDLSAYDGQSIYITIRVVSSDAFVFMLDDVSVTADVTVDVQTAVNSATRDQIQISGPGTVYTRDDASGDVMLDITNNTSFDYDCVDIFVSRAGTGAQGYNGSTGANRVTDKTFDIAPVAMTNTGNVDITFYFTEAEVAGWEAQTGASRNNMVAARGTATTVTETTALTIGAFGSDVTFTGNFSGLDGTYYFGLPPAFATPCLASAKLWDGSNWSGGTPPTASNPVTINGLYDTAVHGSIDGCTLQVSGSNQLIIRGGDYVQVSGDITVDGTLTIEHEGSIVQTDANPQVINNGTINVLQSTPNLASRDFMILGSPMTGETRSSVWGSAFLVLDHNTPNFVPHPDVETQFPGAENFADDNNDFWQIYGPAGTIDAAEGYLVRPQAGYGQPGGVFNYTYDDGTLHTGNITFDVLYNTPGPTDADNKNASPNALANPYASAIFADDFINANSMIDEVFFWEHLTPPSPNLPGAGSMNFSMEDISMYNLSGGVGAGNPEVIATRPNGYIATGQGFGIKATAAGQAVFRNSMRRTTNNNTLRNQNDKDRLWVSIINAEYEMGGATLIAFNENATPGVDSGYDSRRLATVVSLYSHLPDGSGQLGIQTREAFESGMEVPLGFSTQLDANLEYKISLPTIEGENLNDATVYLIDTFTGTTTNLTEEAYAFSSTKGTFHGRFVLQFEGEGVLGTNDTTVDAIVLAPNPTSGDLHIRSTNSPLAQIIIYDALGRRVDMQSFSGVHNLTLDMSTYESALYFVELRTEDGHTFTRRVLRK
ncbi:MAG: choice-of-anchor J domain-containing protein [Bacteroidota bacterium]